MADWKAFATSSRQSIGATAPVSDTACNTASVAGVDSSSKYQARVSEASITTLMADLR